jgi:CheY-like chemotaxis protein
MMGGDITVESRVGEGAMFTIRLPLTVEVAEPEAEPGLAPSAEARGDLVALPAEERVVLVIDDDPDALDLLTRALRDVDVKVVTASDGETALELARSLRPAAITLDVLMPGMDGWEVLQELKGDDATRDIPVFMVSMTGDRQLGYALGATEFLTKPVRREQLVRLLDRHTSEDGARDALVVDDRAENRAVLRRALEREGWLVAEADNGAVALEKVAERQPALILLDLMMPVMDGFDFVMEMRRTEAGRRVPIVVVTAKELTEDDRRRLAGNVEGLIEKVGLGREALLGQLQAQIASTRGAGT